MTHDELVARAVRWLKNTKRCGVIVHEWYSACREFPDAIGWRLGSFSYLVECKVSVEDFHADKQKHFRRENKSAGSFRYYMTPRGLLDGKHHLILPGWGLLEVHGRIVKEVIPAVQDYEAGARHEVQMLYSALRRISVGYKPRNLILTETIHEEDQKTGTDAGEPKGTPA